MADWLLNFRVMFDDDSSQALGPRAVMQSVSTIDPRPISAVSDALDGHID